MFDAIKKGFEYLYEYIGTMFEWLLDGIVAIIEPIVQFFTGLAYLFYSVGLLLFEVLLLLASVAKLALGLIQGLLKTLTGLSYSGVENTLPNSLDVAVNNLQPIFATLQFNKLGYIIIFGIWLYTALAATRILSNLRGGVN